MPEENKLGCLGIVFKLFGLRGTAQEESSKLPYRMRDNFLSPAELSFFLVLRQAIQERYYVTSKVRISDLIYVVNRNQNMGAANRIDRKHVDFLLCDPATMQPILAIELDDSSHARQDRADRDKFVDTVFQAAGLPVLHVAAARSYSLKELAEKVRHCLGETQLEDTAGAGSEQQPPSPVNAETPICPKCRIPLVERKATKGKHKGKRFWACPSYPECKELVPID